MVCMFAFGMMDFVAVRCNYLCCYVGQVTELSSSAESVEPASVIRAHTAHGSITVICQDWVSSLKLGQFVDSDETR